MYNDEGAYFFSESYETGVHKKYPKMCWFLFLYFFFYIASIFHLWDYWRLDISEYFLKTDIAWLFSSVFLFSFLLFSSISMSVSSCKNQHVLSPNMHLFWEILLHLLTSSLWLFFLWIIILVVVSNIATNDHFIRLFMFPPALFRWKVTSTFKKFSAYCNCLFMFTLSMTQ